MKVHNNFTSLHSERNISLFSLYIYAIPGVVTQFAEWGICIHTVGMCDAVLLCLTETFNQDQFTPFICMEKHAFISTRLHNCNALYSGVSRQLIENAVARLLTRSRETTTSHQSLLTFACYLWVLELILRFYCMFLNAFICDLLTPYVSACYLRSSSKAQPMIPKSRLVTKGDRTFAVQAPLLLNSLPEDLRQANPVSPLKTHFYLLPFSKLMIFVVII